MNVLFISGELIAADLCLRLKDEGCNVKLYIEDESRKDCLEGMVEKTDDWKKELNWVGKDGLIIFDDVGYGQEQDELRAEGYNVVGGSLGGDKLEKEREFAQVVFSSHGMTALKTLNFHDVNKAIKFIKKNKDAWVVKQNSHFSSLTYIGTMEDGSDAISILESYRRLKENIGTISLQKKVSGIEVAVARYFNGNDWIGPIEFNIEHKRLFNSDIGPMTGEMGTVIWYSDDNNIRLFQQTLEKIKPYLKKVNFKGDIDINCIVDREKAYPLEATARFGCPSTQLQAQIHLSPWKEFLMAIAKGENHDLKYKKGYGIVVSICVPPFPYKGISAKYYSKGANIFFKEELTEEEKNCLHFEEVILKEIDGKKQYVVAGSNGFILYVTGFGATVEEARKKTYNLIDKIIIPKMFYRTDIGEKFIRKDKKKLEEWGWI